MEDKTTNFTYISLANKYRPQKFEDMVGQESISKTLQNALKSGRLAHAYLFYGPRGCGKTTTARILAKALNCTGHTDNKPTAEPCGKCPQCLEIAQSADLDVLELDAASNTQVEKVREAIIDTVALAASRDRFKVFILDEVHMLSASSFNALLKTIEEPPAHVVFILATTEKHKVPATIVSRCQTFRFRPLTTEEITTHLLDLSGAENIDLTPAAAKIIAKNAGGAMRDALTLLDRAIAFCGGKIDEKTVADMLGLTPDELLKQALGALVQKDNQALHQVFQTIQAEGFDANSFLKDLKNTLGESFYFVLGQGDAPFAGAKDVLDGVSPGFLAQLSRKINKLCEEVKFSDNALISAEVGLFTVMDSCLDISGLISRLEALERGESLPPATPRARGPVSTDKPASRPAETTARKKQTLRHLRP
ncbi:MAG: DNA polymerase III subunit gamma/tau [Elusimicrobiaceae bacterium]|nr:DNA polymerase III subunit gamma/tau [Elusimicrobiaceae bacterium]